MLNKGVEKQLIIAYYRTMNIEALQLFTEVYRAQGFAEVAKARNIAPSSVTRTIALLEDDLGFRLFHRTTRKVTPTEEGEKFFERITGWLSEFESIKAEVAGHVEKPGGTLRVTTNVSFNHVFLVDLISKFTSRYPDIRLEVQVTDRTVDMISNRVDVAIRFGKLKDSDFMGVKLFNLEYALVGSPKYFKQCGTPKRLNDLGSHSCLSLLLDQFHSVWKFKKLGKTEAIKIEPKLKVTGALSLVEYAKSGAGIAMIPRKLVEHQLKTGELLQVLKSFEATPTDFGSAAWLVYPSKEYLPARTRLFIDCIKAAF